MGRAREVRASGRHSAWVGSDPWVGNRRPDSRHRGKTAVRRGVSDSLPIGEITREDLDWRSQRRTTFFTGRRKKERKKVHSVKHSDVCCRGCSIGRSVCQSSGVFHGEDDDLLIVFIYLWWFTIYRHIDGMTAERFHFQCKICTSILLKFGCCLLFVGEMQTCLSGRL